MSNFCSHEIILHVSFQNSHLNMCYYHQDLHQELFHQDLHPKIQNKLLHPPTHCRNILSKAARFQSPALAPSIFRASPFGRWVVTHSLADFDFHDHRPAVQMNQHPLWYLMSVLLSTLTLHQVHPSSPVLLTKNGPLRILHSTNDFKEEKPLTLPI